MAKLKPTPIEQKDLEEFLASESDFGFEMKVLSLLRNIGFECEHAGTYEDPVTKKIRQFDLRVGKAEGGCRLMLAVECKNLRPNFPLLVSTVPRTPEEAFHEVILYKGRRSGLMAFSEPETETVSLAGGNSIYAVGEAVGKRTDQVGRTDATSELISDDAATFDKTSQAINSSEDLVADCLRDKEEPFFRVVAPVLVVPSGSLWQVDYDREGAVIAPVRSVNEATMFVNHSWRAMVGITGWVSYRISHLHIVTVDILETVVNRWMGADGFFRLLRTQ